jgi:hypothetical protein
MTNEQLINIVSELKHEVDILVKNHSAPDGLDSNSRLFYFEFQERIYAKIGQLQVSIINLETQFKQLSLDIKKILKGGIDDV